MHERDSASLPLHAVVKISADNFLPNLDVACPSIVGLNMLPGALARDEVRHAPNLRTVLRPFLSSSRRHVRLRSVSVTRLRSLPLQQPAAPCAAVPRLRASRHYASTTVAPCRRGLCATTQVLRDLLVSATTVLFARMTSHRIATDLSRITVATRSPRAAADASMSVVHVAASSPRHAPP